jgi:hypothetical protein
MQPAFQRYIGHVISTDLPLTRNNGASAGSTVMVVSDHLKPVLERNMVFNKKITSLRRAIFG